MIYLGQMINLGRSCVVRSKSRSVDHGISSAFDIEALRSKVDGQVDKNLDRGKNNMFFSHLFACLRSSCRVRIDLSYTKILTVKINTSRNTKGPNTK